MNNITHHRFPKGLKLLDALIRDITPAQRARLEEYGNEANSFHFSLPGDDNTEDTWPVSYRWTLESPFKKKLIEGELVATGIIMPPDPREPRRVIPPELWSLAWADFDKSSLENDDVWKYVNIEILLLSEYEAWLKKVTTFESSGLQNNKPDGKLKKLAFEIMEDGQVRIGQKYLHFRGTRQFSLVKQLLATGLTGKPIKLLAILGDCGFAPSVDSLSKAFKDNPSWPLLRPHIIHQQGFVHFVFEAKSPVSDEVRPKHPK